MVTEPMVRSATRGMKEAEASQMAVLNDLFAPLSKRRAKEMGVREDEPRYVARLSQAVESCDSLDKVAIGASCSLRLGRLVWGRLLMHDGRVL